MNLFTKFEWKIAEKSRNNFLKNVKKSEKIEINSIQVLAEF